MNRRSDDALINLVLIVLGGCAAVLSSLWAILVVLARLHDSRARVGLSDVVNAVTHLPDPGVGVGVRISPLLFWAVVLFLWIGIALIMVWVARGVRRKREMHMRDPEHNRYLASRSLVERELSGRALVKRASWLRPGVKVVHPCQVGWLVGTSRGVEVYVPYEEAVMIASIARIGKGRFLIIPAISAFDGAVLTTSVRADNLNATWRLRAKRGPIAVFAPLGLESVGADKALQKHVVSFSLISGCADPVVAVRRARALVSGLGSGVESSDFWESRAAQVLAALLAAADVSGESVETLVRWSSSTSAAHAALDILSASHDMDLERLGSDLATVIDAPDERTAGNQWVMVSRALSSLAMSKVREAVDGTTFDIEDFIARQGSFYIVLQEGQGCGPLSNLIIEEFWHTSMMLANRASGGRCEPPLFFALDEIVNLGRPPSLMAMATAGGGSGITTMVVVQSMEQARASWGVNYANGLWDAVTTTIVQGGLRDEAMLRQISELSGEHVERRSSTNFSGYASITPTSTSMSETRERNISPARIRDMSEGKALLVRKNTPVVPLTLKTLDERHKIKRRTYV